MDRPVVISYLLQFCRTFGVALAPKIAGKAPMMRSSNPITSVAEIPILILLFHREEVALKLIEQLREIKPKRIYIRGDGGRFPVEHQACESTRYAVLRAIDWDCEISCDFSEENLGCRRSVTKGVNWFFSREEFGVILEEDCLPDPRFFDFVLECRRLLSYQQSIGHIGGHEVTGLRPKTGKIEPRLMTWPDVWGWATTSSLWSEVFVNDVEKITPKRLLQDFLFFGWKSPVTWLAHFRNIIQIKSGKLDSWASIWAYSLWSNRLHSISPSVRLVRNVGLRGGGTHFRRARKFDLDSQFDSSNLSLAVGAQLSQPSKLHNSVSKILGPKTLGNLSALLLRALIWALRRRTARQPKLLRPPIN